MQSAINNHLKERIELLSSKIDWCGLSINPNITWDSVQSNPYKPWNWYGLSINPNITWDIVNDNPDKAWNWYGLSKNPNITWDIVIDNPDKAWDWGELSMNPNITWDVLKDNLDKPWKWLNVWSNPNILMTDKELCEIVKRVVKAKVIQRYWRTCITNPSYLVCKKRLLYEHGNM
jgi:hypothetical protein